MTTTRRPRDPLPDWAESGREGTESLRSRQQEDDRELAQGTAELSPPPSRTDVPAIERTEPLDALAGFDEREDRTKVDVSRSRRQAAGAKRQRTVPPDEGEALVGATLGSYRLLAQIGRGGMGYVYRAEHVHLGREVALKLLRSDYAKRKDAVARFFQEARTVNRVRHRNIVDVTDLIELEDGTTFIIMELLTGLCLSDWARRPMEVPRILAVLAQICDGLAAAHSVHVVHRDLKPDNVIISRGDDGVDSVKLLDFGVAKLIHREDDDVAVETAAGSVVGTPAYMSPEQAGGLAIDGRSDIYSLGAIMYELFCGQPMFRGRSFGEFVRKHLTELPLPPRATARGKRIDPRLEAIILRAIDKDPDRRYQTILELRDEMLALAATLRTSESGARHALLHAPEPSASADDLRASGISGQSLFEPLPSPSVAVSLGQAAPPRVTRGAPWYVWFVGGAVAVALGIGGAAWYALSDAQAPAAKARTAFEVSLESRPAGAAVFEAGSATIVCRTPCALTLTPGGQANGDLRHYVLRAEGYAEALLSIDLRGSQHRFLVELAAAQPAEPAPPEPQLDERIEELAPLPPDQPRRVRTAPPRTAPSPSGDLPDIPDEPAPPAVKRPGTAPRAPGSDLPMLDDPPAPAPRKDRRDPRIDRSETIDPFRPPT